MKKYILIICSFCALFLQLYGQGAYHRDTEFIIRAGAKQADLRFADVTALDVGIDYTPWEADGCFTYSFTMDYNMSKDHWSFNPIGATSILLSLFCKNIVDEEETLKNVIAFSAFESMKFNFAIGECFELGPNWSLLRISKWKNGSTYVTGEAGAHANFYFGPKKRLSLRAKGAYSWGYGNADWWGEQLFNWLKEDEENTYYEHYKKPHTPFKGWVYGISIGYRF